MVKLCESSCNFGQQLALHASKTFHHRPQQWHAPDNTVNSHNKDNTFRPSLKLTVKLVKPVCDALEQCHIRLDTNQHTKQQATCFPVQ